MIACTQGAVRLRDGAKSLEGRLEICYDEEWGTICDDMWSINDASVACRQLGFSAGSWLSTVPHFKFCVKVKMIDSITNTYRSLGGMYDMTLTSSGSDFQCHTQCQRD